MVNGRSHAWEGLLDIARFGRHIRPMRTILAVLLAVLPLALGAAGSAQAQAVGAPQIEQYINSIRSLQARFVQTNPNGSVVQGTVYVRRPGRMRFEYDAPSQLKVVADGTQVTLWDPATRDWGQWPIGWTAASFLVKEPFQLSGDLLVERIDRAQGLLEVTLSQARRPQEGKVIVRLSENPMALRGWTIIDQRGNRVNVSLNDVRTGMQLADSLFKYDGPDPGAIRRGPN
jgi:outer membrane lipoprotein-sorting protein